MTSADLIPSNEIPGARACYDILLIDDDVDIRAVLSAVLQGRGYSVLVAPEGKTALQFFLTCTFRLVITDIFMPVMDGLEVIMKHAAAGRQIPLLAMSGGSVVGARACVLKQASLLGSWKTLSKPFEIPELLSAVEALIGRK